MARRGTAPDQQSVYARLPRLETHGGIQELAVTQHAVHGMAIDLVQQSHAQGRVGDRSEQASDQHTAITPIRYDDVVRVGGRWRFASRGLGWQLRKRWRQAPANLPPFLHATGV